MHQILGRCDLFDSLARFFWNRADIIVDEMISTFGVLIERWWQKCENQGDCFHENCSWKLWEYDSQGYEESLIPLSDRLLNRSKIVF